MNHSKTRSSGSEQQGDAAMSADYVFARYPSPARKCVFITDRIRVNTVVPGRTMTPRPRQWLTTQAEEDLARNQCLPERISPERVASMVLFFAADDSGACTAGEFKVDAGWA